MAPVTEADAGDGWRVTPGPTSQTDIEEFVRDIHDHAFHGIPWPDGWRVRWGDTDSDKSSVRCFAMCVYSASVIVIARRHVRGRYAADFLRTLVHELAHMHHGGAASHGEAFRTTLDRAFAYVTTNPMFRSRAEALTRTPRLSVMRAEQLLAMRAREQRQREIDAIVQPILEAAAAERWHEGRRRFRAIQSRQHDIAIALAEERGSPSRRACGSPACRSDGDSRSEGCRD